MMEFFEDYVNLEELTDESFFDDIPMHIFKKTSEICEDENAMYLADLEKLNKNSTKKIFKRVCDELNNS